MNEPKFINSKILKNLLLPIILVLIIITIFVKGSIWIENSILHNLVQKIENLQNDIDELAPTNELLLKDKLNLQIENRNFHSLVQKIENLQNEIDDLIQTDEIQLKDKLNLQIENSNFYSLVHKIENLQSDIDELAPTNELLLKDKLTLQKDLLFIEKDKANAQNAIYGTIIQAVGGMFFFVTAYFSLRNVEATEQKQVAERFSKAVEQLGNKSDSDKLVQLGGIYALERIANDSEQDRWTIMKVMISFIRETSPNPPNNSNDTSSVSTNSTLVAISILGELSKYQKDRNLDLSNTKLAQGDLKGAYFRKANLKNTNLEETVLIEANLENANLENANLENANLENAILTGADLSKANLKLAYLYQVNFTEAKLMNADLEGADLSNANFKGANLDGAIISNKTNFFGAKELKVEQIKAAKDWEFGIYSEDFRKELGLSPINQED
ncbi:MAG: hypothetical protein F6K54_12870 [Okeania sp. SIO3B5]|uniref:pentapeptide repeat-containing protein n=1 Tax=Okeania sp. SIO3B5 TaxID=2607811 RepID=UPI00140052AE|nr:pentapeptide repeat-containing protein [Okeania sp. SIO3B5]NEO53894.1 hypothetical protein [Okeania sp. SIO3B5]